MAVASGDARVYELRVSRSNDSFALTLQQLQRECLPKTPRLAGCGATSPLFFCPKHCDPSLGVASAKRREGKASRPGPGDSASG
jgi:hypothetical protein